MDERPDIDGLVERARCGDADAFTRLYEQFASPLFRFVLFRVGDRTDAEDIVQRVFLNMIEALPSYERRGAPFAAWLFRIARNAVIDHARVRRDHASLDEASDVRAAGPGPAELAEIGADNAELALAIARLTPDQRDVIALRFFAGLTPGETAVILGRREGAVRVLQFRALASLRRLLRPIRDLEARGPAEAVEP